MGFAGLAGINFKLPMLGAGDSLQVEGAWAKGAVEYTGLDANPYSNSPYIGTRNGSPGTSAPGPIIALFDSYVNSQGQALSTSYSMNAELRHFWTPTIRSSIAYGYSHFQAPSAAKNPANTITTSVFTGTFFSANYPDGSVNQITANLIWSPVPRLDLGLEALWGRITTDCAGLSASNCAASPTVGKAADYAGGIFRARRDF
jgi:hypothetical protein